MKKLLVTLVMMFVCVSAFADDNLAERKNKEFLTCAATSGVGNCFGKYDAWQQAKKETTAQEPEEENTDHHMAKVLVTDTIGFILIHAITNGTWVLWVLN